MTVLAAEAPIDVAALWHRLRYPIAGGLVALILVAVLATIGRTGNNAQLDPRNAAPTGARALATLLNNRGVTLSIATSVTELDAAKNTTILITDPGEVSTDALRSVAATAATVVVVDPLQPALDALQVPATPDAATDATTLFPDCGLAAARTAGSVRVEGDLYAVHGNATSCYTSDGDAALVASTRANGATTITLGSPSTLSNSELAKAGNAALALGILDTARVQWVPNGLLGGRPPTSQRGLLNLLPSRMLWAVLQLCIALVVFALWRARRLGRPVVEPLPVVVRAAETVEGQARLMHAAKARDGAANALRAATIRRLTQSMQLGTDDAPASVVALVAERARIPAATVNGLLYGGEPRDDAALVKLAQDLPTLETAVERGDGSSLGGHR